VFSCLWGGDVEEKQGEGSNLKGAFGAVKKDIQSVREEHHILTSNLRKLNASLDGIKKDFVPTSTLNVLKIQLGTVREELKNVEKLHAKIQSWEKGLVKKEEVDNHLREVKSELISLDKKIQQSVKATKLDKLVEEMNDEFSQVRKDVENVEGKGGKVAHKRIQHLKSQLNSLLEEVKSELTHARQEHTKFVKKQQVNALLADVNTEFNSVKEEIEHLRESITQVRQRKVITPKAFDEKFEELNFDIKTLIGEVNELRDNVRMTPEAKKKVKEVKAELKHLDVKTGGGKSKLVKASSFFIVLAFLGIAASIGLYLEGMNGWINLSLIISLILFVIGIILRVTGLVKKK
jgi:prefoldin subunit 5